MKDSRKLIIVGVAFLLTATLFSVAAELAMVLVRRIYQYQSKPSIQLVEPKR